MNTNRYDYALKFILVGDIGVGKSSIINRITTGKFDPYHQFTVGVEFASKIITVNGKIIKFQIWDTAGHQQFKAITRSYYRSSAAALVVFDITSKQTFRSVSRWVQDVRNNSNKDVVLVLIGNKIDKIQQRMVSRNQALKLARDYQMLYLQTSALTQQNIQRAFLWPATNILDKIQGGFINIGGQYESIKVGNNTNHSKNDNTNCQC